MSYQANTSYKILPTITEDPDDELYLGPPAAARNYHEGNPLVIEEDYIPFECSDEDTSSSEESSSSNMDVCSLVSSEVQTMISPASTGQEPNRIVLDRPSAPANAHGSSLLPAFGTFPRTPSPKEPASPKIKQEPIDALEDNLLRTLQSPHSASQRKRSHDRPTGFTDASSRDWERWLSGVSPVSNGPMSPIKPLNGTPLYVSLILLTC